MSERPQTWATVSIVDVLSLNDNGKPFQQGWSPQCATHPAPNEKWGVLRTTAIQPGKFWDHENKELPEHLEGRTNIEVKLGDLLMTCAGPRGRCGVVCMVERTRSKLMMSGKMYRFRPNNELIKPQFLALYIQSREAQIAIDRMKTGISDSGLNLTHDRFSTLQVPLAPLKEQDRIITKIDEMFTELDKGVENLKRAQEQLSAYKKSVLKHVFEGKLTAQSKEREFHARRKETIPTLSSKDMLDEHLAPLPAGWSYVRLEQVVKRQRPITYGVIKLGAETVNGVPTLRSSDVRSLRLDLDSVKRISPDIAGQYSRTFLEGGEVLITVRGTLGGVATVPKSLAGWNISREVAMIAPTEEVDPLYLQYLLASPQLESWFKARLRGIAYTGINLETLRATPIVLCSIAEQREIAKSIEERFSLVDAAEKDLHQQLKKESVLREAILNRAFSGQLVMQDDSDEPISALLKRIKAKERTLGGKHKRDNKNGKEAA